MLWDWKGNVAAAPVLPSVRLYEPERVVPALWSVRLYDPPLPRPLGGHIPLAKPRPRLLDWFRRCCWMAPESSLIRLNSSASLLDIAAVAGEERERSGRSGGSRNLHLPPARPALLGQWKFGKLRTHFNTLARSDNVVERWTWLHRIEAKVRCLLQ